MASIAPTTDDEQTWYAACHRFFATGDADARKVVEQLEASEDSATRDRYLQLKDAARRQAHAEAPSSAGRSVRGASRRPAGERAADDLVRRARRPRATLGGVAALARNTGQSACARRAHEPAARATIV